MGRLVDVNTSIERKRRRNAAEKEELLSRYRLSQLSKAEFVKSEGICLATLHNYLKSGSNPIEVGAVAFMEVDRVNGRLDFGGGNSYRISCGGGLTLEVPPGFCSREVASLLDMVLTGRGR